MFALKEQEVRRSTEGRFVPLECCVESVESAYNAVRKGGVTRLEICTALSEGGLTPSLGLFRHIRRVVGSDVFLVVLIRPRAGDFAYSQTEIAVMEEDIQVFRDAGANGIVVGALTPTGDVDESTLLKLIKAKGPDLELTFHRAIDVSRDPIQSFKTCCQHPEVTRVLTSGGAPTAIEGVQTIRLMMDHLNSTARKHDMIIAVGSGVTEMNGAELIKLTGAHQLHGSLREEIDSVMQTYPDPPIPMGGKTRPLVVADASNGVHVTERPSQVLYKQVNMVTSGEKVQRLLLAMNEFFRSL